MINKSKLLTILTIIPVFVGLALYLNDINSVKVDFEKREWGLGITAQCTDNLDNIEKGSKKCNLAVQEYNAPCVTSLEALNSYLNISGVQSFLQQHPDADIFVLGRSSTAGPWEIATKSGTFGRKNIKFDSSSFLYDHWSESILCNGTIYPYKIPTPYYGGS